MLELCANRCGDVNAFNADGDTALHGAVDRSARVVKFMLEHGARADMKNKRGLAPLDSRSATADADAAAPGRRGPTRCDRPAPI